MHGVYFIAVLLSATTNFCESQVEKSVLPSAATLENIFYRSEKSGEILSLPKLCTYYPDSGFCLFRPPDYGYVIRWYYNTTTSRCEAFWYSQCGGNQNRFLTEDHCGRWCTPRPPSFAQPSLPSLTNDDTNSLDPDEVNEVPASENAAIEENSGPLSMEICSSEPERGNSNCNEGGESQRFYWDPVRFNCIAFKYNGCGGNLNNFESMAVCRERCQPQDGTPCIAAGNGESVNAVGNRNTARPPRSCANATCPETHVCSMGAFFATCCLKSVEDETTCSNEEEALRAPQDGHIFASSCSDLLCPSGFLCEQGNIYAKCCRLLEPPNAVPLASPPVVSNDGEPIPLRCIPFPNAGNCNGREPRWYYEYQSGTCQRFYFSGCGGNGNNFPTEQECQSECTTLPRVKQIRSL